MLLPRIVSRPHWCLASWPASGMLFPSSSLFRSPHAFTTFNLDFACDCFTVADERQGFRDKAACMLVASLACCMGVQRHHVSFRSELIYCATSAARAFLDSTCFLLYTVTLNSCCAYRKTRRAGNVVCSTCEEDWGT